MENFLLQLKSPLLILGIGTGFDVYGGLPIAWNLGVMGKKIVLANIATKGKFKCQKIEERNNEYYPESRLSVGMPVYSIGGEGVKVVYGALLEIIEREGIEDILLIDGGVDSIMTGDEVNAGTILEDFISLSAVDLLGMNAMLACIGFTCETEEGLDEYLAMENISKLIKKDAFIGSYALTKQSSGFDFYKSCCESAWQHGYESHIHKRIIRAVEGEYGEIERGHSPRLGLTVKGNPFLNPLMGFYWFFDVKKMIEGNKLIKQLNISTTRTDAMMILRSHERSLPSGRIRIFDKN